MAVNRGHVRIQANIPKIHSKPSIFQEAITVGPEMVVQAAKAKPDKANDRHTSPKRQIPEYLVNLLSK